MVGSTCKSEGEGKEKARHKAYKEQRQGDHQEIIHSCFSGMPKLFKGKNSIILLLESPGKERCVQAGGEGEGGEEGFTARPVKMPTGKINTVMPATISNSNGKTRRSKEEIHRRHV